jgi:hypothetical protein
MLSVQQERIDNLTHYFFRQVDEIEAVNGPSSQGKPLFQKILFAILLDTLSIAASPEFFDNNKRRFVTFIGSCSAWQDQNKVSSPQLLLTLENRQLLDGAIYHFVNSKVKTWGLGGTLRSEVDPTMDDIAAMNGSKEETAAAQDSRYDSLLYAYRNTLLHEFREPGYGFNFPEEDDVFYHSMMHASGQEGVPFSWQISFPVAFFRRLCLSSIWGLHTLLTKEHRDPYDAYPFGSLWRPRRGRSQPSRAKMKRRKAR